MYITYTDIEDYLNVTLTAPQQTQVNLIIDTLEAYVNQFCNRTFEVVNKIEKFDGGTQVFFISNPPIDTINSITVDGTTASTDDYVDYTHYIKFKNRPDGGFLNIVIDYDGGLSIPNDVKGALIQWVSDVYRGISTAGKEVSSVTVGSVKIDYDTSSTITNMGVDTAGVPAFVNTVLNKYRIEPLQQ